MTSLLDARTLTLLASTALAIASPVWMLWPAAPTSVEQAPLTIRPLNFANPPMMDAAIAAIPFSPARDPNFAPPTSTQDGKPIPTVGLPRLVGLISRQRGKAVALVVGSDGSTVVATPGKIVDGWELTGVSAGQAKFRRGGEQQVIALDYSNKVAGAASQSVQP